MIELRNAHERGHAQHGWLDSWHTFSFADYYDPKQMGWGALRVINDDTVQPGGGFPPHGHNNMEIISYVLSGALAHKDSTGGSSVIRPGDVQVMTAGTGVVHSEFNGSDTEPVHFLQIWIVPQVCGAEPAYREAYFGAEEKRGRLRLIASPDERDGSLKIHQDAYVYVGLINGEERIEHTVQPGRRVYVHVARGEVTLEGQRLGAGDGVKWSGKPNLHLSEGKDAEVLVFDLP
jgi:redox-sensitive bicupin YhaK (pirin superfamily)